MEGQLQPNEKTVKIEMFMKVESSEVNLMKVLEHHMEWLIDLDSWPEIKCIFGVKVNEINEDSKSPIIYFK